MNMPSILHGGNGNFFCNMQPPCGIGKAERPANLYCRSTGLLFSI